MVEYVARITKNHYRDILFKITDENILHELDVVCVNHCLPFEQVADEQIETYLIKEGKDDYISECKYKVPSYLANWKSLSKIDS